MPMIPGSALKGLAASFAHTLLEDNEWRRRLASEEQGGGDSHNLLFGTTEEQGLVTFHDALWDPNSKNKCLSLDTVTVHHREYYQDGPATSPPTDWDSPIPIPFLSMTGNFLFALTGPPQWVHAAQQILEVALLHMGIGAKTSSGYGRMQLTVELSETEQVLQNIYRRIERFVFPDKPGQMQKIKQELEVLCHENINREQKQDILKRFFQKANQLDKPIRKDVRNYLKQSLDNWPNTEEKELLDKIWDAVFSETTKTPTEDATSQKNAEQVSSHNLNWTEKVSELIQEMSTLTEENLKKALPNWITSTFNSTPSKKELMTFLTTFESTLKEKYNLSGKDVKTLRDSAKKLIRKHNF
jgi:CRISPR type III-B/RAMP module RAMP protein Cmr6